MSYETREVLNQPFEFEEVLIDSDARRTLLRAGKTNGVFASSEAPRAPSSLLVRKIAVRLRTINNACEAPFRTHDGRPVTEVSMYGSRDRQYLVGPYWAVHRLMAGELPPDDRWELHKELSVFCKTLETEIGHVKAFLNEPEGNSTDHQVEVAYQEELQAALARRRHPSNEIDTDRCMSLAIARVRRRVGIKLALDNLDTLRVFSAFQAETITELRTLESRFAAAEWYWGMSVGIKKATERFHELRDAYRAQCNTLWGPN